MEHEARSARQLWVEEERGRRRMPDPVRDAAVRAVMITSVTLIQAVVAFLCTVAGAWPAFPVTITAVASTIVATWSVLDIWITRQVWRQRNGVVSEPSSTARPPIRARHDEHRTGTAPLSEAA
ncbi:hypothetical protein GCM10010275_60090 [Streptomyces litmocidini]|uniref:hypothetical protein n=1 Tax=Streptomyces litmocidini TaxID=67318 RepID=UPI0019C1A069|nr:hypothetical protein [Streptomyces litmocidini]GGV11043.1 hypothetical protein GCM10010275_60090 [Streptomyces litmocidini]